MVVTVLQGRRGRKTSIGEATVAQIEDALESWFDFKESRDLQASSVVYTYTYIYIVECSGYIIEVDF